eukprot:886450_1
MRLNILIIIKIKKDKTMWAEISGLSTLDIIKIETGAHHSLFLDSDGILYVAGESKLGQRGQGTHGLGWVTKPQPLKYFVDKNIKIKDIKCGMHHSLVLTEDDKVFAWGWNMMGQCG